MVECQIHQRTVMHLPTKRTLIHRIVPIGALLICLHATASPDAQVLEDNALRDSVAKVSVDASFLMLSSHLDYGMKVPAECLVAESMSKTANPDKYEKAVLTALQAQCNFVNLARNMLKPVFRGIASTGRLPIHPLKFELQGSMNLFSKDSEPWDMVGLFADTESCNRLARAALDAGFGVREVCTPWKPRF